MKLKIILLFALASSALGAVPLEVHNFSGVDAEIRFSGASFFVPPGFHDLGPGYSGALTVHLGGTNQVGAWDLDTVTAGHKALLQVSDSTLWVSEPWNAYGAGILGINLALGVFATSIGYHFIKQIGKNNPEV